MAKISLLTLNIRRDRGDDGINNWEYRKVLVADTLERYSPDVAVFQEVLVHQLHDLQSMLPGYDWSGVGRDDGVEAGEFAPIFHRGLTLERSDTFWFSDTPSVPSCTWPGMTRICTWVDFGGQLPFAVFNVHLEYQYQETQDRSIGLLRERLDSFPAGYPVLLAGDFNFRPDSAPYRTLSEFACDSYRTGQHRDSSADRATCHSFTGETTVSIPHASRIDYIWGRGSVEMSNHKIINDGADDPAGVFPSDHWPVMCEITIEGR